MHDFTFVILAAGKGTRFSKHSKLLYPLCGKSILSYVIDLAKKSKTILVTNHVIADSDIASRVDKVIIQENPAGTGHAFQLALNEINDSHVFILLGDSPLILQSTIEQAINKIQDHDLVFGGFRSDSINSYGRIRQINGKYSVIEHVHDPSPAEFYNAGWICFNKDFIKSLPSIDYVQQELYLTQYIELADRAIMLHVSEEESIGVNSMEDYTNVRRVMNKRLLNKAFLDGAKILDPESVSINFDTVLEPNCEIGPYVTFGANVVIESNAKVLSFSYIEESIIDSHASVGPFAYIRGNSVIGGRSAVGAFCEVNRSRLQSNVKVKHLSYIGDGDIGNSVNIGAGTVFCNYNGKVKSKTTVMDNAFLGGNCAYVAPVLIGSHSYVGAGTVVREDVPNDTLVVAKSTQIKYKRRYEKN